MVRAFRLFPQKRFPQFRRGIVDAEVVARSVERPVRRVPNPEHSVEPGEIAVGTAAPELTREFELLHFGPELQGLFADGGDRADVLHMHALFVVHEEDRDLAGLNQFFDLILTFVAVHGAFFTQSVRLIHKNA